MNLKAEAALDKQQLLKNASWKACTDPPPSLRCELYLKLWKELKPLPDTQQKKELSKLRNWANYHLPGPHENKCMSASQLQHLASNKLFDIGAHTESHLALNRHSLQVQTRELLNNKEFLKQLTGKSINLLTYPHGDYNTDTLKAALDTGFDAAFTTQETPVTHRSLLYSLGRFQVRDVPLLEFNRVVNDWQQLK